ncbi:unnamed protein product [Rotaria magnacalcarata]|uniref:Uncharacterized protein n=1 Tax=Rotaria magnacalcarata TaxID=392030 RepID=A0A816L099_9BILA|nr:unnamed protein product [Rotaria magnacalcarata]CAF1406929.1 unnamed protein product [Rotaria magnacalcarata]CAF1922593.1 unnamed protein product [Rotaria magnacalcarata]
MSFNWSASSNSLFTGVKPAATNSFADALKRLAEHVEEKNKIDASNGGTSSLVQLSTDFSNRMIPCHVNNSMLPEQTLRLCTQHVHEAERREDIRRCYLRTYGTPHNSNSNTPPLSRRPDITDPYRFMAPHLSSLLQPTAYLQLLAQQTKLSQTSQFLLPNINKTDATPRIPIQENTEKRLSEQPSEISKPKLKLFRPYDLDDSPTSKSHQSSPSSPSITNKKSTSSPLSCTNSNSTLSDESQTRTSSGKEKQLFNSLGLVQQSTDIIPETSSQTIAVGEDSTSMDDNILSKTKDSSSLSTTNKRKSVFSSNQKQPKINKINNTVK